MMNPRRDSDRAGFGGDDCEESWIGVRMTPGQARVLQTKRRRRKIDFLDGRKAERRNRGSSEKFSGEGCRAESLPFRGGARQAGMVLRR